MQVKIKIVHGAKITAYKLHTNKSRISRTINNKSTELTSEKSREIVQFDNWTKRTEYTNSNVLSGCREWDRETADGDEL